MLLIVTSTGDELFIGVNVDDLEWPWALKIGVFSDFFAISGCNTQFKSELCWNGWRWTWTTSTWHFWHKTYIIKNLSFDVLNSWSLPYGGLKFKYFFKMHLYLIAVGLHWLPKWQDRCYRAWGASCKLCSNYLFVATCRPDFCEDEVYCQLLTVDWSTRQRRCQHSCSHCCWTWTPDRHRRWLCILCLRPCE